MSSLRLYAETPRAGQYGHRFLVPEGVSVSESEVVSAFSSTKEGVSFGRDHIAVGRKVKQLSLGGTTRDGLEVIVLTGLNAATLPDCRFNQLVEVLRRHSLSLESLVLTGINWGKVLQDTIIVPSSDMRDWLYELERVAASEVNWSANLTSHASANSDLKRNSSTNRATHSTQRTVIAGGAILFFGGCLGAILGWLAKDFAKVPLIDTPKVVEHSEPRIQHHWAADSEFGATENNADSTAYAVHFKKLIEKAIHESGSSIFINIITAWPDGVRFPDSASVYDSLLDRCKARLEVNEFEEVLTRLNAIASRENDFPRSSQFDARFDDIKNKAEEGVKGKDSEDARYYETFRIADNRERKIEAAREYLKAGEARTMRVAVEQWLRWAESPVVLEISAIDVPTKAPYRVLFEFDDKTVGLVIDNADSVSASTPLSISLSSLGILMYTLPCECNLYAENQSGSTTKTNGLPSAIARPSVPPARLEGKLLLNESLGRQWKDVELSSDGGFASSAGKLKVRMKQEHEPRLREWGGGTND